MASNFTSLYRVKKGLHHVMILTYGYQTIGRYHSKWLSYIKLVFGNPIRCAKSTIPFAISQKSIYTFGITHLN